MTSGIPCGCIGAGRGLLVFAGKELGLSSPTASATASNEHPAWQGRRTLPPAPSEILRLASLSPRPFPCPGTGHRAIKLVPAFLAPIRSAISAAVALKSPLTFPLRSGLRPTSGTSYRYRRG